MAKTQAKARSTTSGAYQRSQAERKRMAAKPVKVTGVVCEHNDIGTECPVCKAPKAVKPKYHACRHGSKDAADCLQCKAEANKAAASPDNAASRSDIEAPLADLGALVVKAAAHADKLRTEGNVIAMVKTMSRVKTLIERIKSVSEVANELYDRIRINMLPSMMEDAEVENVRVEGVGLCYLADDLQVTQLDKEAIIAWLVANHFEDLIKETVNAQTFGAWIKQRLALKMEKADEDKRYPKDLVKLKPFTRAAIRAGG